MAEYAYNASSADNGLSGEDRLVNPAGKTVDASLLRSRRKGGSGSRNKVIDSMVDFALGH